ncbi:MAG TPA: septal ring lytic transglycosylase RlpA family protein [Vicinamibacteria bacterium]|nr:septal ring lytic transglycosylase RlpA family protein [Vicinamibacteria bacterium]
MWNRLLVGAGAVVLLASGCSSRRAPVSPGPPPRHVEEGLASWYGIEEAGRATASGEIMDPERMTAAHKTLPFGSLVRVTDLESRQEVEVIINDRGPFVKGRIIDLSFGAARELGLAEKGVTPVRIEVLGLSGPLAERRWRVQVGSFSEPDRASELMTLLQAEGHSPVVVSPFQSGPDVFHRVWVGAFDERDPAERLARALRFEGHQGIVVLAAAASQ